MKKKALVLVCFFLFFLNAFGYSDRPLIILDQNIDLNQTIYDINSAVTGIYGGLGIDVNDNIGDINISIDSSEVVLYQDSNNAGWLDYLVIANPPWLTFYTDTNAETACSAGEVLTGDGTCSSFSTSDTDTIRTYTGTWGINVDNDANVIRISDDFNATFDDYFISQTDGNNWYIEIEDSNNVGRLDYQVIANPPWITEAVADTNAETACSAGEVLYGDGSCGVPASTDTNWQTSFPLLDANLSQWLWRQDDLNSILQIPDFNNMIINLGEGQNWELDTNAETACSAGEVLYGDGSCAVPTGTDTNVWTEGYDLNSPNQLIDWTDTTYELETTGGIKVTKTYEDAVYAAGLALYNIQFVTVLKNIFGGIPYTLVANTTLDNNTVITRMQNASYTVDIANNADVWVMNYIAQGTFTALIRAGADLNIGDVLVQTSELFVNGDLNATGDIRGFDLFFHGTGNITSLTDYIGARIKYQWNGTGAPDRLVGYMFDYLAGSANEYIVGAKLKAPDASLWTFGMNKAQEYGSGAKGGLDGKGEEIIETPEEENQRYHDEWFGEKGKGSGTTEYHMWGENSYGDFNIFNDDGFAQLLLLDSGDSNFYKDVNAEVFSGTDFCLKYGSNVCMSSLPQGSDVNNWIEEKTWKDADFNYTYGRQLIQFGRYRVGDRGYLYAAGTSALLQKAVMMRDGHITGISMEISGAGAFESWTATVYKNGLTTGFNTSVSGASGTNYNTQPYGSDTFSAGDYLEVYITGAHGAVSTPNITAIVEVVT